MIRFAYQSYPIRGPGATRYVIVHRPVIPFRIVGISGHVPGLDLRFSIRFINTYGEPGPSRVVLC